MVERHIVSPDGLENREFIAGIPILAGGPYLNQAQRLGASTGHKTQVGANLRPQPLTCSRNLVMASRHRARDPEQKSADRL